jgi:hypothetical protein
MLSWRRAEPLSRALKVSVSLRSFRTTAQCFRRVYNRSAWLYNASAWPHNAFAECTIVPHDRTMLPHGRTMLSQSVRYVPHDRTMLPHDCTILEEALQCVALHRHRLTWAKHCPRWQHCGHDLSCPYNDACDDDSIAMQCTHAGALMTMMAMTRGGQRAARCRVGVSW